MWIYIMRIKNGNSEYDAALAGALGSLAPPGIVVGHRVITPGDEDALLETEATAFRTSVLKVRRQGGAARIVMRQLVSTFGLRDVAFPKSPSGAPVWPSGLVGSLAHDDTIALAAVASLRRFAAVGIDVEPAIPLPLKVVNLVATPRERRRYPRSVVESRALFAAKEAIYKAQYPIDGLFLDFHDVEVDLDANQGLTRSGRRVALAVAMYPRVLALAFISAS